MILLNMLIDEDTCFNSTAKIEVLDGQYWVTSAHTFVLLKQRAGDSLQLLMDCFLLRNHS